MDLLKRELERKKKALEAAKEKQLKDSAGAGIGSSSHVGSDEPPRRFFKAGELRRLQEEQEEEERLKKKRIEEERKQQENHRQKGKRRFEDNEYERAEQSSKVHKKQNKNETTKTNPPASASNGKDDSSCASSASESEEIDNKNDPKKLTSNGDQDASSLLDEEDANLVAALTPEEVTRRLRELGQPVRLFGERTLAIGSNDTNKNKNSKNNKFDDTARWKRLQTVLVALQESLANQSEMDEYRLGSGHGIRNPFLEKDKGEDSIHNNNDDTNGTGKKSNSSKSARDKDKKEQSTNAESQNEKEEKEKKDDEEDVSRDPHKKIYKYFKGLLKQWEAELAARPDSVKRTAKGKNETKTVKQCKDYIRPLFKLCKRRTLEPELLQPIVQIVDYSQQGEFVRAHDTYMDLAIGRAAWPIGVTMVGIHARSGRAKIETGQVAHVMNSELQRKYLTSIKRLLTFAQKLRPDVDPSKKVT